MKTYLTVYWLFCIIIGYSCFQHTSPESFPFIAFVESSYKCTGFLISVKYVVAPAACVDGKSSVVVHLGYSRFPHFKQNLRDPKGQSITAKRMIFHEDYRKLMNNFFLNNIVLIELSKPVKISENIKPGKLLSTTETELLQERFVDVTGWKHLRNSSLLTDKVQLRNKDTCNYFFQNHFLESQEGCINWMACDDHLNILGNVVSFEGNIVGFQTSTPPCSIRGLHCTDDDKILYVSSFSDWISKKVNESTTTISRNENMKCCKEIKNLLSAVEDLKTQQEAYRVRLEKALNAIDELEKNQTLTPKFMMSLNEEQSSIRSEIRNIEAQQNQSIVSLGERFNEARIEISDGLSAQRVETGILSNALNNTRAEMASYQVTVNVNINNLSDIVNFNIATMQDQIKEIKRDIELFRKDLKSHINNVNSEIQSDSSNDKNNRGASQEAPGKWSNENLLNINNNIQFFSNTDNNLHNLKPNSYDNHTQLDYAELYSNVTNELKKINDRLENVQHKNEHELYLDMKNDINSFKEKVNGRIDELQDKLEQMLVKEDLGLKNFTNFLKEHNITDRTDTFNGIQKEIGGNKARLDKLDNVVQECCLPNSFLPIA